MDSHAGAWISDFLFFSSPSHLTDYIKMQPARDWGTLVRVVGVVRDREGDKQDLIKDCLCYVISSKRRRPLCCRDVEQLAWGCLIACSDPFQASSSGAHTRNGTDVYSCLPRRRLHGNRWLFLMLWSGDTTLSWGSLTPRIHEWAQLLQIG